jgi:glutamate racemase
MNNKALPIGIFDSGLGGLTVVKELIKILPNEDLVYLGDTARVPYGTRSKEVITKFSIEDANFLVDKGVKCIIIACNTASAMASKTLKRKLKTPVFDVIEPALKESKKDSSGKIAVIGTRATIASGAYKVDFSEACPLLVPFIEEGDLKSDALKIIVNDYLKKLKKKEIGTLILGCTHYPIISGLIQEAIGKNVKLINPEKSVTREVKDFLTKANLLNPKKSIGSKKFYVTDLTARFTNVAEMFLGQPLGKLERVTL